MCDGDEQEILEKSVIEVLLKLFKNDSYKNFLHDFSMKQVVKKFKNVLKFSMFYETILQTSLKRANDETSKEFEWILSNGNNELFIVFSKVISDTNFKNISLPENLIKQVVIKLSAMIKCNELQKEDLFVIFSKICINNIDLVPREVKEEHIIHLQNYVKYLVNIR